MTFIYLRSVLKCISFDVTITIKIPYFRVSFTIEPGRSLLQFHELFDDDSTSVYKNSFKFLEYSTFL